jgi:hypothetical protein
VTYRPSAHVGTWQEQPMNEQYLGNYGAGPSSESYYTSSSGPVAWTTDGANVGQEPIPPDMHYWQYPQNPAVTSADSSFTFTSSGVASSNS